jgi:hypothetical protein
MKNTTLAVIGAILLLVGGYVLVKGGSITTREEVLDVGPIEVNAEERHPIEPWMGGAGVIVGALLIIVSLKKKP